MFTIYKLSLFLSLSDFSFSLSSSDFTISLKSDIVSLSYYQWYVCKMFALINNKFMISEKDKLTEFLTSKLKKIADLLFYIIAVTVLFSSHCCNTLFLLSIFSHLNMFSFSVKFSYFVIFSAYLSLLLF